MVAVAGLLSFAAPHRSRADQRSLPVLTGCGVLHDAIERARLIFQARRELPRVTAVASQVLLVDRRLAQAEEALRQAVGLRAAAAAAAQGSATASHTRPARRCRASRLQACSLAGRSRPG
jgi:hypothetical protein